jgi:predicted nucleotidyltransferase
VVKKNSGKHKETRAERLARLPPEMQIRLSEFEFGLHGIRDNTKEDYLAAAGLFGSFLNERGKTFENAEKKDLDVFLSTYKNPGTKNIFIDSSCSLVIL